MERQKDLRMPPISVLRRGINRRKYGIFFLLYFLFVFSPILAAWFGQDSCPSHWGVNTGYADAQRFQALVSGTSTRLEILTFGEAGGGKLRMAVYDDSVGHPNHKLWEGTDINYYPQQWCGEDVTTIQLVQNYYFWLAFKTNTTEEICYATGPNESHEWKSGQTFANSFPNPWGSYTGHNINRYSMRMHYSTSNGTKGIIEIDPGIIEGGIIK